MSKHTMGPWTVARNTDDGLDIISSDEVTYVEVALDVRTEADARLLAAAPDLLEALRDLVARCDGDEGVREDGSNIDTAWAHAVIAKAEGGDA